jgi:Flp pilus assembly protein TadD/peroxiredoxin
MTRRQDQFQRLSRRALLKGLGLAPLVLRASPFYGSLSFYGALPGVSAGGADGSLPFTEPRLVPHYPARSPLEDVLRLVPPGSDDYPTELYAFEVGQILKEWSRAFKAGDLSRLEPSLDWSLQACSLIPVSQTLLRSGAALVCTRREFSPAPAQKPSPRDGSESGPAAWLINEIRAWLGGGGQAEVETAEFEITSVESGRQSDRGAAIAGNPLIIRLEIRYGIVLHRPQDQQREERVGTWMTEWAAPAHWPTPAQLPVPSVGQSLGPPSAWKLRSLCAGPEIMSVAHGPMFRDVTQSALGGTSSYPAQLLRGSDTWRTLLDGACGIDVYGNNGVAAGDFDGDGFDDLYVCQPAGLPNRLYRNRGDGTFEDVTERAGVGVLDNTACALFADFRNLGRQDLLVVCSTGPLLFLNQGDGTFARKSDAFQFAQPPQGSFTHAAIADYDRDGRLDIYFCLYSYYLGLDQYHYPAPYYDARNGPPNFLMHNQGNATFVDRTQAAGLSADNDRYSFACAWGESLANQQHGLPDLYVANDFGRSNFYRNNGDGTFIAASTRAHVEDVGAGMSAAWGDFNNDGRPDIYVANMWSAAGQRVSQQPQFHEKASDRIRGFYRRHARGNSLYRNQGGAAFENVGQQAGVEMGRWAWASDFWDFDQDGYPDLYVTNGYITAPGAGQDEPPGATGMPGAGGPDDRARQHADLGSFFWRQVVGRSPDDSTPSLAYERGWNALNELIRSDRSWSGLERNVLFANHGDGTFSEVSGAAGLDFPEDGRSFALADLDHDGRLELVVKNRNAPQLRMLHNAITQLGDSIVFRLCGTRSNRDAIGAAVTVEAGESRQTRYLQAGSGFLAQHSKEVFFGLGNGVGTVRATVRWPSGLTQHFDNLPRNSRVALIEGEAGVTASPFAVSPAAWALAGQPTAAEPSLASIETWLIDPLKAPEFSLPDLDGNLCTLASLRGRLALLYFWSTSSWISLDQLRELDRHRAALAAAQLSIFALNVNEPDTAGQARALAERQRLGFPVIFATEQVIGIYNIIFRYFFDRRRDLAIPTSLLLDKESRIVKVYQGAFEPETLLADLRSIPTDAAGRMRKALPFAGTLYQGSFERNDFTYGVAMFQHGYLDQAAESFQQVVAAKPNDAEGYYNLGTLSLRRNDFAQARQYLEKALQLRPNYPEAWNNLGMMAAQQGQAADAIRNFQQSLLQRPAYSTALLNLGNVYRRQKDFAQAEQCLTRALALEPDDPEANYSLGMFHAQQNQLQSAAEYLQRAVALRPDYPEALNNLGVLFVRQQQYAMAEEQFRTCIRLVPGYEQSYLNLARLYVLQHDKQKAEQALEDLLRLQPQSAAAKDGLDALKSMP